MNLRPTSKGILALATACLATSAAAQATSFSADMVMTMSGKAAEQAKEMAAKTGRPMPLTHTMKVRVSGTKFRYEVNEGPLPGVVFSDLGVEDGKAYMLQPSRKTYSEIPADKNRKNSNELAQFLRVGGDICKLTTRYPTCKRLDKTSVAGRPCQRYEAVRSDGRKETLCVDETLRFPLQVVGEGSTTELRNIEVGPQDPSLFKVPAGYTKTNLGP
jgi:hypothetical protein